MYSPFQKNEKSNEDRIRDLHGQTLHQRSQDRTKVSTEIKSDVDPVVKQYHAFQRRSATSYFVRRFEWARAKLRQLQELIVAAGRRK
jgi:hypothetical protein